MAGYKTFSATTLTASDVNGYLMRQAVIQCTSATRPSSPHEGMTIYETDTDRHMVYSGSAWVPAGGAVICTSSTRPSSPRTGTEIVETDTGFRLTYDGSSWVQTGGYGTPGTWNLTVTQSFTCTYTTNYKGSRQLGNWVVANAYISFTASGSSGNVILLDVSLPSAPVTAGMQVGTFLYVDADVQNRTGAVITSQAQRYVLVEEASSGSLGSAPSMAVASGDTLTLNLSYPMA